MAWAACWLLPTWPDVNARRWGVSASLRVVGEYASGPGFVLGLSGTAESLIWILGASSPRRKCHRRGDLAHLHVFHHRAFTSSLPTGASRLLQVRVTTTSSVILAHQRQSVLVQLSGTLSLHQVRVITMLVILVRHSVSRIVMPRTWFGVLRFRCERWLECAKRG